MAASSGVLTSTTGFIVQTVLIVTAVIVTGAELDLSTGDGGASRVGRRPRRGHRGRRHRHGPRAELPQEGLRPPGQAAQDGVGQPPRCAVNPKKAIQLFGGNLLSQLLFAMVLGAALHAYGESLPILQLVLINSWPPWSAGWRPCRAAWA